MEKVEKQIKIRRYHICGKMEKNGGLRLQLELIKVQVAFFMQFAQKGGKGYEYDII